jgi:ABC-2 type transport system permease protein
MLTVWGWELRRMVLSRRIQAVLAACLLAPWLLDLGLAVQNQEPKDTIFGLWVHTTGWAIPLVILGFTSSWAFPVLVAAIAGPMFAGEDEGGTWAVLLTRSRSRLEVFGGKTLAALTAVVVAVVLLGASGVVAGLASAGNHPLVGLSGNVLTGSSAAAAVAESFISVLAPALALTMLGLLLSVLMRSSIAAVLTLVVLGTLLELDSLVANGDAVRHLTVANAMQSWHGLFADPVFLGPMWWGLVVSAVWFLIALGLAVLAFGRRQFADS